MNEQFYLFIYILFKDLRASVDPSKKFKKGKSKKSKTEESDAKVKYM